MNQIQCVDNQLTDWFPRNTTPVHPGVYEVENLVGTKDRFFSKWNGVVLGLVRPQLRRSREAHQRELPAELSMARPEGKPERYEKGEQMNTQDVKYIVIGYGESDIPVARFAMFDDGLPMSESGLVDAVLECIYGDASIVADDERQDYIDLLEDKDNWCEGDGRNKLEIRFEIGGVDVWRVA